MEENEDIGGISDEVADYILNGASANRYLTRPELIARKVMIELIRAERADFILLRDDDVRKWWTDINSGIQQKIEKYKERVRIYNIKMQAYERLSPAERKTLGIRKPTKPRKEL